MGDLIGVSGSRPRRPRDAARTLEMLATLISVAFAIAFLYVGRDVLVPIAIAVLLSFVLSPPVLLLRRIGAQQDRRRSGGRLGQPSHRFRCQRRPDPAGLGACRRPAEISGDDQQQDRKIAGHRLGQQLFRKGRECAEELWRSRPQKLAGRAGFAPASPQLASPRGGGAPRSGRGARAGPGPFAMLRTIAGTALSPLETTALVVIFVVFILLQREDLRNRFIRLVGSKDLQRTTVAMNDAAGRLSRFFLVQTLVNATYGVIIGLALSLIGVPGPVLFGILAFLMRFVPYVGAIVAAAFPALLAAAVDPGWTMALETLALFILLESLVGNVVEPLLYGRNTGLSPIAVVVAATFWTWLWGPVGLVLSTPLTVCLVVIGRHVDQLSFLDVILGDAPVLSPVEHFYQRLLVGDGAEIADQAEQFLKTQPLIAYYDEVALNGLLMAQEDFSRGVLDEAGQTRIRETIEEVIEDLVRSRR